ncbi:MAG: Gfo/Idh/MocA family oxidoreductase [Planctomycetes bacterium]|nr:Gfo/Idh/MocA family oxidoreductase [Planctomycetota bacterium]
MKNHGIERRRFLGNLGLGALGSIAASDLLAQAADTQQEKTIAGFDETNAGAVEAKAWEPVSDRKIRVGIVGYGLCQFGAGFGFQNHPNVTVAAVSDLFPDRCQGLAKACGCEKTYPSLEELVKDDTIEAVFVATDAPSHARHCIEVMKHGKHVASAVPAVFASLEDADKLLEAVKMTGQTYMLFETSHYRPDCYAMRQVYNAGGLGKLVYAEGEYYHFSVDQLDSYNGWREGVPPQYYPTHSNAYYVCVTGGSFTEVSCLGMRSTLERLQPERSRYQNPFGTEISLFRTSEGGMARMAVSWDTPGLEGEVGRVRGQRGSMTGTTYEGLEKNLPNIEKPQLPPGMPAGGHGGSHGYLTNEFITAILQNRQPECGIVQALALSVPGVVAHRSALKDGELMKVPQYQL